MYIHIYWGNRLLRSTNKTPPLSPSNEASEKSISPTKRRRDDMADTPLDSVEESDHGSQDDAHNLIKKFEGPIPLDMDCNPSLEDSSQPNQGKSLDLVPVPSDRIFKKGSAYLGSTKTATYNIRMCVLDVKDSSSSVRRAKQITFHILFETAIGYTKRRFEANRYTNKEALE